MRWASIPPPAGPLVGSIHPIHPSWAVASGRVGWRFMVARYRCRVGQKLTCSSAVLADHPQCNVYQELVCNRSGVRAESAREALKWMDRMSVLRGGEPRQCGVAWVGTKMPQPWNREERCSGARLSLAWIDTSWSKFPDSAVPSGLDPTSRDGVSMSVMCIIAQNNHKQATYKCT
ncbi:hypothetical protein B0T22DRAFT_269953 [Podospora appendiculata]|uniref:Uncharacterized protein n=1 Tax=Podospora appendiculata TaxID=314037 RepID=A0AAE0X3Z4_9PEZI|nr:hypothetical protein B0T22DRAFT_269953 [Podospora appendiculata]